MLVLISTLMALMVELVLIKTSAFSPHCITGWVREDSSPGRIQHAPLSSNHHLNKIKSSEKTGEL